MAHYNDVDRPIETWNSQKILSLLSLVGKSRGFVVYKSDRRHYNSLTDTIVTFGSSSGSCIAWSMGCWRLPFSFTQSPSSLRVANVETCLFLWEEWERRRGGRSALVETTFPQAKEWDGYVGPELWIFPLPLVPQQKKKKKRQMCFWGVTGSHYSHEPFWSLGKKCLPF